MQRSVRLVIGFLLLAGLASSLSACDGGVQANQNPSLAELDTPVANATQAGTIETDCEQLSKLSMEAEINAMGVHLAWQSSPDSLGENLQDLGRSIVTIQALPVSQPQVKQLRNQYVDHLKSLTQMVQQPMSASKKSQAKAIGEQVKQVANLRRDRIFFASCQS